MRSEFKVIIALLLGLVLLTPFTNCDVYSESSVFEAASLSSCKGENCENGDADILELSAPPEVFILSTARTIDLGGDCNEGDFASNVVTWDLLQSTGALINNCINAGSCGQCVQGRYQLNVSFAAVPVTGWLIEVEIRGVDRDGMIHTGRPTIARRMINVRVP